MKKINNNNFKGVKDKLKDVSIYIPVEYTEIPNFIWLDVIKKLN